MEALVDEAPVDDDTVAADGGISRGPDGRPQWRAALLPYAEPHLGRSVLDLATSVVPYLALSVLMYFMLSRVSYVFVLLVGVLAGGFLLRTYIVFHDCTHGSLLPSKRANIWTGMVLGVIVHSSFLQWRHSHAVHHATAGDLDRRGTGDVPMLTVAEYRSKDWRGRLGYRLFRNPLVMFGLGPLWAMIISPRIVSSDARPRIKRNVHLTNLVLLLIVGSLVLLIGWKDYLLVWGPPALVAGMAGVFLFYVQHQFDDAYWRAGDDWSYADAALQGSSHLLLPQPLQFFSANINLHHVHHLNARIPNYNLQRAHDENPMFHDVPTLTIWDGVRAVRLKLWDEDGARMVTWRQARRLAAAA
jgi:omega-6 fatty acid desaturase (delta-12 desaturase)